MNNDKIDVFPLSKTKNAKGTRRLAREKVLQIITALEVSEIPLDNIFDHAFYRKFNFGDFDQISEKLLTPDEIYELEADIPIVWDNDEIVFATNLIKQTLSIRDYVNKLIEEYTEHWELERIANLDRILMQMAVAELIYFPEIPVKVSINEAIDIAKKYSTPKSGSFINGILDKIMLKLKDEDKIHKTGRGLQE